MSDVPADCTPDNAPDNALLRAIDAADIDAVRALLDAGANPNTAATLPDVAEAIPALYFPCVTNNVAIARLLLERGANPDDGESLYHAAEHDHRECLELLQSFGANLSGRNATYGNTPLHFLAAILHSNPMAPSAMRGMRWLLEHGADPNVASHRSASGATLPGGSELPLHRAAASGHGADVLHRLVQHGALVDASRGDGKTAYALAMRSGNSDASSYLARVGADITRLSLVDQLLAACANADVTSTRALVRKHPDIMSTTTVEDRQQLGVALADGREQVVRTMLDVGWPLDEESEWGGTPLHWAAWNARPAMVRVLLAHHAPVNHRDARYGSAPIAWAAHGSQWNDKGSDDDYVMITTMLLDAGATRDDAINRWDEAPESFARPAVLRVLRERGFIP
jgi:ankyrin repeat protein